MNRLFSVLRRTPVLIVLLIISVFYMPTALVLPPETEHNAIVTALGIDMENDEYMLSLLCIVPQANLNYAEKYQVVSCTEKTVSEGLEKVSRILGKNANLNHIETIILSESMLEQDVSHVLDYFARPTAVQLGCHLVVGSEKAKDVIDSVNKINTKTGVKIEEILRFAERTGYTNHSTLESFYSGYYSPTGTSMIGYIETIEDKQNGLTEEASSEEGNQQNTSQQSGGQPSTKTLSNTGKMVMLKKGVKKEVLDYKNIQGLNYVISGKNNGAIKLNDVEFEKGKPSQAIYEIIENKTFTKIDYKNNMPLIKYNVRLKLELLEVIDSFERRNLAVAEYTIDEEIAKKIEQTIKQEFAEALQLIKTNQVDALKVYEKLKSADRGKFKAFLDSLDDKEDFLNHVIFAVSVESEPF